MLTSNTASVTVPGTLTHTTQWYRNDSAIPGATGASVTVGSLADDPVGTEYTVKITGTGNYKDTLESGAVAVASVTLGGSVAITGDTALHDVLSLDAGSLTPASATYDIQWSREGVPIFGATHAIYTITKPDQDHTLTVTVTGNGYFTGSVHADIDVPPSPYVPDDAIVETAGGVAVDLTAGSSLLSEEQLDALRASNATKPVVFSGDGYSITYPAGALQDWTGTLNLGIRFNSGAGYGAIVTAAGSEFVLMLEFLHSGALPGEAQITIYVGVEYAGQTMRYLYYNPGTGLLEPVALAVVDASGFITVSQDHCSSYAVAGIRQPVTGDGSHPSAWLFVLAASALGLLLAAARLRRRFSRS